MEKFAYRFRSLQRLLDKGELERLQIFFAEPELLNDPLEGYKDIFWSGDLTAWKNLIRHYVTCLTQHTVIHAVLGDSSPEPSEILINVHASQTPTRVEELVTTVQDRILSNPDILYYLEGLSDLRQIRVAELIYRLNAIHRIIAHFLFSEMENRNLVPFKTSEILQDISSDWAACKNIGMEMRSSEAGRFDKVYYDLAAGYMMGTKIQILEANAQRSWFFLLAEFPEAFCKALERLTHPDWYTACFMSSCTNSSVWGSYGENHTGICLMYNIRQSLNGRPELDLNIPSASRNGVLIKSFHPLELHKVDYEGRFAEVDFFRTLGNLPVPILQKHWYTDKDGGTSVCGLDVGTGSWRKEYWDKVIRINTTKLNEWAFENEYRAILMPSVLDLADKDSRQCSYAFSSLHGLIFGINTPTEKKVQIVSILRKLCEQHGRKDFNLYQAKYDHDTNKISHHRIMLDLSTAL